MLRSSPIRRTAMPRPGKPMRRQSARARKRQAEWNAITREAIRLADGKCQVGALGCLGTATQGHHKRLRSQGGKNEPSNVIVCCASCHSRIHQHQREAEAAGFIVTGRTDDEPLPGMFCPGDVDAIEARQEPERRVEYAD